jgi:hypothetical protein
MFNILFLEDRSDRQISFLPNGIEDVKEIISLTHINMPDPNTCKNIIDKINKQKYEFDENLKLIIVHRSILNNSGISYLNKVAKSKNLKLVFFSGGISQVFYSNDGVEQIFLNSTEFYSELLIPFLQNFSSNSSTPILELFNRNWKMSYMMLYRQLIQNLQLSQIDDSNPYTYYYSTKERLKEIETILGVSSEDEVNKLFKSAILHI